jgi:hypothetical protein
MGYKCKKCGTDNGITYYCGKVCKRCEEPIVLKFPECTKDEVKG